ncbi:MAG: ABC transporter ATP-binding protein, partial [Candidatus Heimdallarchaeota archaeon]
MISCRDLIKIFEDEEHGMRIPALRGCDLIVNKGEIVTVVGPSGSGKTTLINILAGLETFSSGECIVGGRDLQLMSQDMLNNFRLTTIGLVDQFPERTLFLDATVEENMDLSTSLGFGDTQELDERNQLILEKLGIDHLANRRVRVLSGGEMIRTAIACALAKNVPILLADEPTGQLDSMNTEKVKTLLREIATTFGTTILVVSHDPRFYDGVDKSCEIRDGRV